MSMQDSTRLTDLVWILAMTGSQSKPSQSKDTAVLVGRVFITQQAKEQHQKDTGHKQGGQHGTE